MSPSCLGQEEYGLDAENPFSKIVENGFFVFTANLLPPEMTTRKMKTQKQLNTLLKNRRQGVYKESETKEEAEMVFADMRKHEIVMTLHEELGAMLCLNQMELLTEMMKWRGVVRCTRAREIQIAGRTAYLWFIHPLNWEATASHLGAGFGVRARGWGYISTTKETAEFVERYLSKI